MQLYILSDLHIEFSDIKLPKVNSDIVILAGDIHVGTKGLNWIKNKFKDKEVIYVLGNHEYYHGIIPDLTNILIDRAQNTNIHVLENNELIVGDIVFLGCTLWTNFELYRDTENAIKDAKFMMNDYRLIKTMPGYKILTPFDTINFYNKSFSWLSRKVEKYKDKKIVVVTHNGPSLKSCLPKYKNDLLTASFVSDLENFIKNSNINIWIHGHVHNSADYTIGNTRIVCNPRGYCRGFGTNENCGFVDDLTIDI